MGLKLVSFSLYGTAPRYFLGAVENAKAILKHYPGWAMRVYCEDTSDVAQLISMGVQIVYMGKSLQDSGILWRFLPAWEDGVDHVIFRDCDSIVNPREAAAVQAWIVSGKEAHVMHDHPHHICLPMMGGMWGVKGNFLPNVMPQWMRAFSGLTKGVQSAQLMQLSIYPHIKDNLLRHSSVPVEWPYEPFPPHESWNGFIGQQHDDNWNPVWPKEN